jgi:DNA-binding MarR family transcriptional regulator
MGGMVRTTQEPRTETAATRDVDLDAGAGVDAGVGTAGDSDELASRLRIAVNRLQRRLRGEALEGLSPAQASALGSASRHGGPTLGELAALEQVQPPTMTRIVAALADAGMVTRQADAADRRSARVRVTPAGERTLARMRTRRNAFLVRRLRELGPDERARAAELVALLEHLLGEP